MMYVNVYLVGQQYGGAAEGGWYYNVGTPLASIPIPSQHSEGQSYYIDDGKIHARKCDNCQGTMLIDILVDDSETSETYKGTCGECLELPIDFKTTEKVMADMTEMFKDEAGRYEHIRVALESDFAQPYPERRPHYE
jgi:hypothetical protein